MKRYSWQTTLEKIRKASGHWWYQVAHTTLGMGIYQVVALVSGILIARSLGPAQQGRFQLLMSVIVFTVGLAKLGLDEGVAYVIPQHMVNSPTKVRGLIIYSIGITLLISLVLGGLFWAGANFLETNVFGVKGFAYDLGNMIGLLPAWMLLVMGLGGLRGLGRSDLRAYIYYYIVGISFLGIVLVLSVSSLTLANAYYARMGSYLLGAMIALLMIFRIAPKGDWLVTRVDVRRLHSFAGLLVFVGLFQYLVEQPLIDMFLVGRFASAEELGVYSIAARVAVLVAIIANALVIVLAPMFSESVTRQNFAQMKHHYRHSAEWMATISLFVGGSLILLREQVLGLFGRSYQVGSTILVVLLIGQICAGILGPNSPLLLANGYARYELILTGGCVTFMIMMGVILGKAYGAMGVALATALSTALLATFRHLLCVRLLGIGLSKTLLEVLMIGLTAGAAGLWIQQVTIGSRTAITDLVSALVFAVIFWVGNMISGLRLKRSISILQH